MEESSAMSEGYVSAPKISLNVETKSSRYDRLSAALTAFIILFGFLFSVLFLIWITSVFDFSQRMAGPIPIVNEAGNEKPKGVADDVLEPGVEEFPEIETPQLANALEAVTDSVSSVRANLEKRSGDAVLMGAGGGYGSREGGPGTGGNGVPEWQRWVINYEAEDIGIYAKQLTFCAIDIGVIHQTKNNIWRVQNLTGPIRVAESNREAENGTLRFTPEKIRLRRWDQELCKRAGVQLGSTVQAQFYPEATRAQIRVVENAALEGTGKTVADIKRTELKVVPGGSGYEFIVEDITYR